MAESHFLEAYLQSRAQAQQAQQLQLEHQRIVDAHDIAQQQLTQQAKEHSDTLQYQKLGTAMQFRTALAERLNNLYQIDQQKRQQSIQTPSGTDGVSYNQTPNPQTLGGPQDVGQSGGMTDAQGEDYSKYLPQGLRTVIPGQEDIAELQRQAQKIRTLGGAQAQVAGETAGAQTSATVAAQAPAVAASQAFQTSLENLKFGQETNLAILNGKQKMEQLAADRPTQLAIARIQQATQLTDAGMKAASDKYRTDAQFGWSPDTLNAATIEAATNPNFAKSIDKGNPRDMTLLSNMQRAGLKPADFLDVNTLTANERMSDVYPILDKITSQLSISRIGAIIQSKTSQTFNSDLTNLLDQAGAYTTNIAREFEGAKGGRVLGSQIQAATKSIGDIRTGSITKQNMQDLKTNLMKIQEGVKEQILSRFGPDGSPQRTLIERSYGISPQWLKNAPQVNSAGHSLDKDKSLEFGQPVYAQQ